MLSAWDTLCGFIEAVEQYIDTKQMDKRSLVKFLILWNAKNKE